MIQSKLTSLLIDGAAELGILLTKEQVICFSKYLTELKVWTNRLNLISRSTDREIILKDFLDSLTVEKHLPLGAYIMDLGSGAGFPGVPVKIIRPDLRVVLFEATRKKVYFLKNLLRTLNLEGIEVQWSADKNKIVEDLFGVFDLVISRAFGSLLKFAKVGLPFLTWGGILLAMKGKKGGEELEKDLPFMEKMGLKLAFFQRLRLPSLGHERILIGLKKG